MAVKPTTFVTIANVRDWVLSDAADASRDALLELLADAASARIERDTSRWFKSRARSELHDGHGAGHDVLYLERFPIIGALTSFTVDAVAVDVSLYTIDAARGRIVLKSGRVFSQGHANIAVTYTAGYADADLPDDAIECCLELCKRLYHLKTKGGQSFETASIGGHSFVIRDQLPRDVVQAIERLRDKRFG